VSKDYSFLKGSWELVKLFFHCYRDEHDTRIQIGGNEKMKNKKAQESISDLVQILGGEVGLIQAGYIYNQFSNRYDTKHEADNLSQEDYLHKKTDCWKNYLRAYYKIPKTKEELKEERRIQNKIKEEALKRSNIENELDNINYRW
jgi:hypothetical protein